MSKVIRSYVCGVTCTSGGPTCNGYCKDQKIPSPGTYELELLNFEDALYLLKGGQRLTRIGWKSDKTFIYHVPSDTYPARTRVAADHIGSMVPYAAYVAMKTEDGPVSPWVPTQVDLLADDWVIVA